MKKNTVLLCFMFCTGFSLGALELESIGIGYESVFPVSQQRDLFDFGDGATLILKTAPFTEALPDLSASFKGGLMTHSGFEDNGVEELRSLRWALNLHYDFLALPRLKAGAALGYGGISFLSSGALEDFYYYQNLTVSLPLEFPLIPYRRDFSPSLHGSHHSGNAQGTVALLLEPEYGFSFSEDRLHAFSLGLALVFHP